MINTLTVDKDKKTLPEIAKEKLEKNPSALGDPVSMKAEKSSNEPTEQDRPNKNARGNEVSTNHQPLHWCFNTICLIRVFGEGFKSRNEEEQEPNLQGLDRIWLQTLPTA